MLFKKEDPKTMIEGIDRALKLLEDRYNKKQITYDVFIKQSQEFNKRREKYLKKMGKDKYDVY